MNEWKKFIEDNKLEYNKNQEMFYNRIKSFLEGEKDFLINQGGMGLGKTKATIKTINREKTFIATPFAQIKNEWSNELNSIKKSHAVWLSKTDCCIKKRYNANFKMEDCDDSCEYRSHLEENKEYNEQCNLISNNLKFPINVNNYYDNKWCKDCLLPLTRNRIEKENIIIGDYFGFLIPKMFRYVTKSNPEETNLHIDEAHMIIERAKQFLSRKFSIGKMIKQMNKSLDEEDYFLINFDKKIIFQEYLEVFGFIKENLIEKIKNKKEKIDRISYSNFLEMWKQYTNLHFNDFINNINLFITKEKKDDLENPKTFQRTIEFFKYWEEKSLDEDYNGLFQYFNYDKEEIILEVNCSDTGNFLKNNLSIWKKVHFLSGTIPDKEYYLKMLGIEKLNYSFEEPLNSYSIKNRVINYGIGNFTSSIRNKTYEENSKLLKDVLKKLKGRTLIYVQAKYNVQDIFKKLREFNPFCFDKSNNYDLMSVKEEFNKSKNGVAITYITGKVEGQNFLDEDGNAVENVIIYGYPYLQRGKKFDDYIKHWQKKLNGNEKKAKEYVEFFPVSSRIYQACMRAKRSDKDNPIILLWGKEFSQGNPGYKYSYNELKGDIIHESEKLLSKIDSLNKSNGNI